MNTLPSDLVNELTAIVELIESPTIILLTLIANILVVQIFWPR